MEHNFQFTVHDRLYTIDLYIFHQIYRQYTQFSLSLQKQYFFWHSPYFLSKLLCGPWLSNEDNDYSSLVIIQNKTLDSNLSIAHQIASPSGINKT